MFISLWCFFVLILSSDLVLDLFEVIDNVVGLWLKLDPLSNFDIYFFNPSFFDCGFLFKLG